MTTRPRSTSRALALVVALVAPTHALAQSSPASEEAQLRARYAGAIDRATAGPTHAGIALPVAAGNDALAGLRVRARAERAAADGGITISLGDGARTTVIVRVVVAMDARGAREALHGWLRGMQATLVDLADARGADVALGDDARGREAVVAAYGNVALAVERTREAAGETPDARTVLDALRARLAPAGSAPVAPTLSLRAQGGATGAVHIAVACSTGALARIDARVRGGHVRGAPGVDGVDVVRDAPGALAVRIVASDALGRTASASVEF